MALPPAQTRADDLSMETAALTTLLANTWFGANLLPSTRARVAVLGRLVDIQEGSVVVREGMPCQALGLVISGRIALRLGLPGGEDRTILTVEAGDVFGWSAVLPPAISTSTGVAVAPSTAILFDGDELRAAMTVDCELAAAVYQRLLVSVARRLTATRVQLLDLYRPGSEPW
jgi:CRP/FNR family transcriptional regulator, cyclic AMP receptor protein